MRCLSSPAANGKKEYCNKCNIYYPVRTLKCKIDAHYIDCPSCLSKFKKQLDEKNKQRTAEQFNPVMCQRRMAANLPLSAHSSTFSNFTPWTKQQRLAYVEVQSMVRDIIEGMNTDNILLYDPHGEFSHSVSQCAVNSLLKSNQPYVARATEIINGLNRAFVMQGIDVAHQLLRFYAEKDLLLVEQFCHSDYDQSEQAVMLSLLRVRKQLNKPTLFTSSYNEVQMFLHFGDRANAMFELIEPYKYYNLANDDFD